MGKRAHLDRTTRRKFIELSAAALAGVALPASDELFTGSKGNSPADRKLIVRTLGRTGIKLPIVSMGSSYDVSMIRTGLEQGFVHVHTSSGYADGNHERILGQAVRGLPRDSFVVATAADLPNQYSGSGQSSDLGKGADPRQIIKSLEISLQNLGLDYVDIYYLASIANAGAALHEPYLEAFAKLKKEGKTRSVGLGTHANEPLVIRAAAGSKFWDVVLTSFNFRQSHREEVRAAIREAAGAGLGVVVMKTQAGVYWDRARKRKINMKAALKWALQEENVTTAIPSFANFEEMREDFSVARDLVMTEKERKDLDLGDDLGFSGHYCQQCGHCLPQCPAGIDIPILMRSSMYAFAYGQPSKARHTMRNWRPDDISCTNCGTCPVECALGLDVRSRALDLADLLRNGSVS